MEQIEATQEVWELLNSNEDFSMFTTLCLHRFTEQDWGEISEDDVAANNTAILNGDKIIGSYVIPEWIEEVYNDRLWSVMNEDRSTITMMFAGDF